MLENYEIEILSENVKDADFYLQQVILNGMTLNTVIKIRSYFSSMYVVLNSHSALKDMANILFEFGISLTVNLSALYTLNCCNFILVEGIINSINRWIVSIQNDSEFCINCSLKADIATFMAIVVPQQEQLFDIDSIFNF